MTDESRVKSIPVSHSVAAFALDALVAAGHVSREVADKAIEIAAYTVHPSVDADEAVHGVCAQGDCDDDR